MDSRVVPYHPDHLDKILEDGMNNDKIEIDARNYKDQMDFRIPGMSFTCLVRNIPVVGGGVFPIWNGVGEGWLVASKRIFRNKLSAVKAVTKRMDQICYNNKIWRLQTAVRADYPEGLRFAKFLGYKSEGLMEKYGLDKSDYYRMAKIYEFHR